MSNPRCKWRNSFPWVTHGKGNVILSHEWLTGIFHELRLFLSDRAMAIEALPCSKAVAIFLTWFCGCERSNSSASSTTIASSNLQLWPRALPQRFYEATITPVRVLTTVSRVYSGRVHSMTVSDVLSDGQCQMSLAEAAWSAHRHHMRWALLYKRGLVWEPLGEPPWYS